MTLVMKPQEKNMKTKPSPHFTGGKGNMKYFSMFSGIGGFELGIQRAIPTAECVGFSEIDKYAIKVYTNHFKTHRNYGNATTIDPRELSDFELLVGGFPCQAFSVAGKRAGFEDTRGTLFFEIARILSIKKPKLCLLENVTGLLSHDNGNTFRVILEALYGMGYVCEWQVFNSRYFNVPQNRERIFIVGHLGGISGRTVFPIGTPSREYTKETETQRKEISQCLTTRGAKSRQGADYTWIRVAPVLSPKRKEKRQNGRQIKEFGEPSFTLTTQDRHGITNGERIREMTPIEWERLQSFPDNWTQGISDCQRYKCLGNSVTVNVIEAIINKMLNNSFPS